MVAPGNATVPSRHTATTGKFHSSSKPLGYIRAPDGSSVSLGTSGPKMDTFGAAEIHKMHALRYENDGFAGDIALHAVPSHYNMLILYSKVKICGKKQNKESKGPERLRKFIQCCDVTTRQQIIDAAPLNRSKANTAKLDEWLTPAAQACFERPRNKTSLQEHLVNIRSAVRDYCKLVADYAMQVMGGSGYCREYPVERLWRDAKLLEIGGGTLEAHQKNLTKDLAKLKPI